MKLSPVFHFVLALLAITAPAAANDSAIANCGPNDGYVTLYTSLDTYELAARLPCGAQLELLDSQKSYASQHTPYLRVATVDGKQGYVARAAVTITQNGQPSNRPPAAKSAASSPAVPLAQAALPSEVRVLDGTELAVKLSADLSSDRTAEGAIVNLEVAEPLVINGVTVFERSAPAHARITQMKRASRWGHDGEISWTMRDVTAVDGTRPPVRFVAESQNASSSGAPTGVVAASGNVMLVEPSSFRLRRGDEAFVPAGQIFRVFLHGDTTIHIPRPTAQVPR